MNISRLTTLIGFICVVLSFLMLGSVFMMNHSIEVERDYSQRQQEFRQLGFDLEQASDFLTREARLYTISGDKSHYDAYWKEVNETQTRDRIVKRLKELEATQEELDLIEEAKANSDALVAIEKQAMQSVEEGDLKYAQALMFDHNYDRHKQVIMRPVQRFQKIMNARAEKEAHHAMERERVWLVITNAIIVLYVLLVLFALYFILVCKISRPLRDITEVISSVSSGNTDTPIPYRATNNEIGYLAQATEVFRESLIENKALSTDLQRHRDRLEEEVEKRTKDLQDANDELEEFAYRTSHDLRSPLVSSMGLLKVTEKAVKDNKENLALETLGYAQKSLKMLENLVKDILALTQVKNVEEDVQSTDINVLVDTALDKFSHMDNFDRLKIEKSFAFEGDLATKKSRITLIVENLISNAIKYQDPNKENAFIKISTSGVSDKFVLEVIDNGLGIPEEHQSKLFAMFKRFHPKVSFGSGLGLYMIKKSAEIIGGEITYRDPGEGSVFKLSIPIKINKT